MDSKGVLRFSVVIPVYKRTEWLGRCLGALAGQNSEQPFEVVIVDDGSPNEQEICAAVYHASHTSGVPVRFFRKVNGGPAAARNFGVRESSGTIICFLDDDSIVGEQWLEEIVASFYDTRVSVVSGRILSYDRDGALPMQLEKSIYCGYHWATCNIAYRRDLFDRLGGFDEGFRHASWEDNDLGLRARWVGARQIHNERAIVYHSHEKTFEEYRLKCLLNGRGAAAFMRKYLLKKPLWALATPVIMSRFLALFLCSSVIKQELSASYLKYLWSINSLRGFLAATIGSFSENNTTG